MKPRAIAFILMLLALVGIAGSIHDQSEPAPQSSAETAL